MLALPRHSTVCRRKSEADLELLAQFPHLTLHHAELADFSDTAALLAEMDLDHQRRFLGGASGRRIASAGMGAAARGSGLSLAAGAQRYTLVSQRQIVQANASGGVGRCDCRAGPGLGGAHPAVTTLIDKADRLGVTGLRPSPLPHHRTCGFPHPAVEPCDLRCHKI